MTSTSKSDGSSESTYYVIYVLESDRWKKTHNWFDSELEAVRHIESGELTSNGKGFTIIKEKEQHIPSNLFFIRKKFSSKKEKPVMCTKSALQKDNSVTP